MTVIFIERSQTVILIYHIVDLQLWRPAFPDVFTFLSSDALNVVWTNVIDKVVVLQLLAVTVTSCPERGSKVKTTNAVVHVKIVGNGISILVHAIKVVLETEAFALRFFELNAHNRLGRGGIARSGVLYHVDVLNLVGAQA